MAPRVGFEPTTNRLTEGAAALARLCMDSHGGIKTGGKSTS